MRRDILILVIAVATRTLSAQATTVEPPEGAFKLTSTSELVLLDVGVKDAAGEHVGNLGKENFRVYEDGKLQEITQFESADVPVTVGLVIDTSGSMRSKYPDVVTAGLAFIQASNRQVEMFIVNFGDRVSHGLPDDVPFTDDVRLLRTPCLGGRPRAGRLFTTRSYTRCNIFRRAGAKRRPWCWSATGATTVASMGPKMSCEWCRNPARRFIRSGFSTRTIRTRTPDCSGGWPT